MDNQGKSENGKSGKIRKWKIRKMEMENQGHCKSHVGE